MRFLVTGNYGYIGSHLVYHLRNEFPTAIIHGMDYGFKHFKDNTIPEVDSHWHEIGDDLLIFEAKYDCIFHLAATSNVPDCENNPIEAWKNNIGLMDILHVPHKNFIFASSASVRLPRPTVYAQTKLACESLIHKIGHNYRILRLHNVAGCNVESGLVENHIPETHLIPNLVRNPQLEIYGSGNALRDYVHVDDVCRRFIANALIEIADPENPIEVGTGVGSSVHDVIKAYERLTGRPAHPLHALDRLGDNQNDLVCPYTARNFASLDDCIMDTIKGYRL